MATLKSNLRVPAELFEGFRAEESPSFEVVREAGSIRLWRTTTAPRNVHGVTYPGKAHYHVTRGERADILFMGNIERAVMNFEATAAQQLRS